MTTQSHYASVQTQRGYCLFIFHVKVMDGLCKEEQKERQMVKESSLCLICIRNWIDGGGDSIFFPISGCALMDVLKCLHSIMIEFLQQLAIRNQPSCSSRKSCTAYPLQTARKINIFGKVSQCTDSIHKCIAV